MFRFDSYYFDPQTYTATFNYIGAEQTHFAETIHFQPSSQPINAELLDRALFLCFMLIGTSYYKAHPTPQVSLDIPLDTFQVDFFNTVYQEGLSQFAFENQLTRADLAHFVATAPEQISALPASDYTGILSLQSGGKDSLLTATLLRNLQPTFLYINNSTQHPAVLDELGGGLQIIQRQVDRPALATAGGRNGHVPITYIVESLALAQAILNHQSTVVASIGREGDEPHAMIGDLAVNHQWSKTWPVEQLLAEYVERYISPDLHIGSPLRGYSELKIAELFVQKCWKDYGHKFSSCNVANYRQAHDNQQLTWCGECAKCANAYLLFAPFVEHVELDALFAGQSLFTKPQLIDTYKGLLGIDGFMKPFECIGSIDELRKAYELKLPGYPDLPFTVPKSDFDYTAVTAMQPTYQALLQKALGGQND